MLCKTVRLLGVSAGSIGAADVDPAHPQMVGIRVFCHSIHTAHDNFLAVVIQISPVLNLCSREGHAVIIFPVRAFQLRDIILNP